MRKVTWRFVPFLVLCYVIAYIDRTNVGFAALQMREVGISESIFGLGATFFFVAYVLFEIPSNLALRRFGARIWIARIMTSWGIVGACTVAIAGPNSFYLSRFLLGAAEAGFFPGVILFLTYWFPRAYRARVVALFMAAIPLSNFLGSPVSAFLLGLDGKMGLQGWQWVFLAESIPAILAGIAALRVLASTPANAAWLNPRERGWLVEALADPAAASADDHGSFAGLSQLVRSPLLWAMSLVYCGSSATSNALSLWQPQILKSYGLSTWHTGLLNMVPFGLATIFMILWGRYADRTGERRWSTGAPLLLTASCLLLTNTTNSLGWMLALLTLILIGNYAVKGPFWALATETLPRPLLASGIAAINTLAHLGTGAASALLGLIKERTGSFPLALVPLAVLTFAGALVVLAPGRKADDPRFRRPSEGVRTP